LSIQLDDYLREAVVTDDGPGLLLDWDEAVVDAFVASQPTQESLLAVVCYLRVLLGSRVAGTMSRATFTNDVVTYCAAVGGGRVGVILIAPNDFRQYHLISRRLAVVETDGFLQGCMAQLAGALGLAKVHYLADKTIVRAQPMNCAAPPGFQMVFS
jgi:hypothetical protein